MKIEELLHSIEQHGWRLHTLRSEPGPTMLLQWGASIRVNNWVYGHSYSCSNATEALEEAILDAEKKTTQTPPPEVHQQWDVIVKDKKKRVTLTIEDIFNP